VVQADSLGDERVRLARAPRVSAQQRLRALVSPHGDCAPGSQRHQVLPLLIGQFHDVLLVHRPVLHGPAPQHEPSQPLQRGRVLGDEYLVGIAAVHRYLVTLDRGQRVTVAPKHLTSGAAPPAKDTCGMR